MVLRNLAYLSILTLSVASCGNNVKTGRNKETNKVPDGAQLYMENCATCHGIDGALGKAGSKDLTKTALEFHQLKSIIENGTNNGMPRFKEILETSENADAVVQYVMGLKRING